MFMDITPMPSRSQSPWLTTSRSLLNRLSLLRALRPPSYNLTDFHISLDDPYRKYSPGDTVKGTVVLTVIKPIRITHLTVCLHGFLRVFKSPSRANEPLANPSLSTSHKSQKSPYVGNAYASLFQDEVTLCGEGRLDMGIYEFKFELVFPSNGLPTSIDFERGTISYLITATITQPTSVNSIISCCQKISLVETVDIGAILPPKPRTIFLTSFAHKSKRKSASKRSRKDITAPSMQEFKLESGLSSTKSQQEDTTSFCWKTVEEQAPHRNIEFSENQSIKSAESSTATSKGSGTSAEFDSRGSCLGSSTSAPKAQVSKRPLKDQKVTATIELSKSGCLPGDNISVKITVKHRKPIRSMYGAIITLYRQGRIDSIPCHAPTPHLSDREASKWKHEEYYPRSKTGLGGLSLNSAGSSSIFRKDLAQTFAPIIIDPNTLTAIINTSIRVPEYVFPTIKNVPGQMIMFKYNVEVVLDLGGKLSGQQKHMPLLRTVITPSSVNFDDRVATQTGHIPNNILTVWGGVIVGTDAIRREKNIVASTFEVTVGSKDSVRSRKRDMVNHDTPIAVAEDQRRRKEMMIAYPSLENRPIFEASPNRMRIREELDYCGMIRDHSISYEDGNSGQNLEYFSNEKQNHNNLINSHGYPPLPHSTIKSVMQPEISADEALNEKERVKRAEERLLPSSPPTEDKTSFLVTHLPIVPSGISEDEAYSFHNLTSKASLTTFYISGAVSVPPPSQEACDDFLLNYSGRNLCASDDKYENERQRLLAEASSPFVSEDAIHNLKNREGNRKNSGSFSMVVGQYPSAPVLNEEEDELKSNYVSFDLHTHPGYDSESPPRYEK